MARKTFFSKEDSIHDSETRMAGAVRGAGNAIPLRAGRICSPDQRRVVSMGNRNRQSRGMLFDRADLETVLRGFLGFGAKSRIHTSKVLRLSEDLPVVVEIVDAADKIEAFLPKLDTMIGEGLVTLEKVRVIVYRHNSKV